MSFAVVSMCFGVQPSDDPKTVLNKAQDYYKAGQYDSATIAVRVYLKNHGNDSSAQYLVPLLIESAVRTGDFDFGQRLFQIYQKKFPSSAFLPRLWYLQGTCLVRQKSYNTACVAFSNAIKGGVNAELDSLTLRAVQTICEKALTADEIGSIAAIGDLHPLLVELLRYCEIAKLYESGQIVRVKQKSEQYISGFSHSPYVPLVKAIVEKVEDLQKGLIQIGLLAPLSGYDADIGRQIVQGIQISTDQYAATTGAKLNLIICDTRGNMIETARKTLELVNEHHVSFIIGPVLSQNAVVSASILMDKDVVMLSPTANDEGIASLGQNIFQMNVTLGTLGAKIARYAMDNCNIRDFAIIGPSTEYGAALSRGFRQEVEKSGREIVMEQTYEEGTKDFKVQFDNLKARLMQRKQQRTGVEKSLVGDAPPPTPAKPDMKKEVDTTYEIGGIFMPSADAEEIVMLAPQVAFHRIKTQLLGSLGWHNPKVLVDGKEYVTNALFSTSLQAVAAESKEWQEFKAAYKSRFGVEPDRVAALGYDAASLLLNAVRSTGSNLSAQKISPALSAVKGYKGASGMISFDPVLRINTETAIMKIKDKQFIRVQ
jgi:ABC-type branched-subunit amino acid transport system substrate-binding protein